MDGSDGLFGRSLELMKVVMMRCWMECPHNAIKISDTLALLRRIFLVFPFPHGPQRPLIISVSLSTIAIGVGQINTI